MDVLEKFRAKYPEYDGLGDDQVIRALGTKYPEYRNDAEFGREFLRVGGSESLGARLPAAGGTPTDATGTVALPGNESGRAVMKVGAWEGPDSRSSSLQEDPYGVANREYQAHLGLAGGNPELRARAENIYKARLGELGIPYLEDIGPVEAFGKVIGPAVHRGTKALRAAVGDVAEGLASSGPGFLPLPNITSFANDPEGPLPIERRIAELEPGAARTAGKAGLALAGAPVPMGLAVLGGELGLPQSAANVAAMGFDEEGKLDPVGALAAVGLPVTDAAGRSFVREAFFRKELFKFSPDGLKDLFARVAKGEGSQAERNLAQTLEEEVGKRGGEASVKATGVETSAQQKAAEVAGGLLADNVYMLGLQLPGIMGSEDPKAAVENAVAGQLGWMFMGLPELMGGRNKYEGVRVEVGPEQRKGAENAEAQRVAEPAKGEVQTSGLASARANAAAPQEAVAPAGRQPWEMAREEYANVSPYPATQLSRAREHGRLVAAAVAAGQPVPQNVLDEYREMLGTGTGVPATASPPQENLAGVGQMLWGGQTGNSAPAPATSEPPYIPAGVRPPEEGAPGEGTGPTGVLPAEPRVPDVLDAIEELGGIAGPRQSKFANKGEYDGYEEAFGSGPAKGLRRATRGGLRPDELRDSLAMNYGFQFETTSQMYEAVRRASEGRSRAAEQRKGGGSFGEGSRGSGTKSVKTAGVSTPSVSAAGAKASGYAALPAGKPSKTVPIVLGGMAHVRPMEMPEIVRMAKELMGSVPTLKRFATARGMFYAEGQGKIKLHPDIFKDSIDAARTLAHEVGHLADYLPDKTMARGNLLGRLWTLKSFLKDAFGPGAVRNKDLRAELVALTRFWKPYDPATSPRWFVAYRESAVELYADALSVLMNDPALLEARAPKFWKAFWQEIDRKPEVKRALFDAQDLLNQGKVAVLDRRQGDIEAMFAKGEEVIREKAAARELRRKSWKGFWLELKQQLADVYEPIVARVRKAEAAGATWRPAEDPRNILESGLMVDNTNMRFVQRIHEGVLQPVEELGMGVEELGRYLFLRRVQTQRAEMANPLGITPAAARDQLLKMRLDLGLDRMTRLEVAVQKFHDLVFEVMETAVEVGSYNKEAFDSTIAPNRDVYAAFAVLDYLEDYVPAAIRKQVGTLAEIANPFTATVLKTITLNNLNTLQRSRNATRDMLRKYFAGEIEGPVVGKFLAAGMHAAPPAKADWGQLEVLENGKKAYYYVDPLVAHAFDRMSPQGLHRVTRVLDVLFRKGIYRAWITYGPSFLMFNPFRDFARSWQNMDVSVSANAAGAAKRPGVLALALAYARTFRSAVSQVRGMPDALATEMMANYAIGAPHDTLVRGHRDDAFGDLLRRFHLLPEKQQGGLMDLGVMRPIRAIGAAMEFFGSLQETLPKTAVYKLLRERGLVPAAAAAHVRNFAGTPNIFKKGRSVNVVRAGAPFYNVFLQGWRSDLQKLNPRSASGFLFKWAASDGLWAILMALASAGVLGSALKDLLGRVSEYDKTNYNIIPVGWTAGGDYGKKTVYLRIPRSESSRLLSGLVYKLTRLLAKDAPEEWTSLLDFGAGQMPSVNPVVSVPLKWSDYLEGHQPMDSFRGRPIVPDTEWKAGGLDSLKPMLRWTWDQSGGGNFVRWDPKAETVSELVLSATPGLNRLLKVSDYGMREEQTAVERGEDQERARHRLTMPDNARQLLGEYMFLRKVDEQRRTPAQVQRYELLNVWYNSFYRPLDETVTIAEQGKQTGAAASLRAALEEVSKGFERPKR